jgi:Uma2 family endonuclease
MQLEGQLPPGFELLQDIDVDLELVGPDQPGTARRPDVFVVDKAEYDRVDEEGGLLRAGAVPLAIEIVSPGSRRADYKIKRDDYADAGIPHYWVLDIDPPTSMATFRLAGELGYATGGEHTGLFATQAPFPLQIDLDALV